MNLLSPSFGVFFWQFVTIFLVLVILKVFAYKVIVSSLEERKKTIDSSISNSIEIDKRLENIKLLEKNLELEIDQKKKKMIEDVNFIKNELLEKARKDVENEKSKMIKKLESEIEEQKLKFEKECDTKIGNIMFQYAKKFFTRGSEDINSQKLFMESITEELENDKKNK